MKKYEKNMKKYAKYLYGETYQFGCKEKIGTNHAIYTMRRTVNYFVERDSTVTLCAIDLAKVFNKLIDTLFY